MAGYRVGHRLLSKPVLAFPPAIFMDTDAARWEPPLLQRKLQCSLKSPGGAFVSSPYGCAHTHSHSRIPGGTRALLKWLK